MKQVKHPQRGTSIHSILQQNSAAIIKHAPALLLTCFPLLALTFWMWWLASDAATKVARERFEFRVSETHFAIQQRLLAYTQVLRGGVAMFAASDEVTRNDWRTYIHNLDINNDYPGIQGLGFSMRIRPEQREAHIQAMRAEGFPNYTLWPDGERSEYTAIVYLEPFDWRNQRAFGYDMFSEPVRQAAMTHARDSGSPAISGKVTLVQETGKRVQNGFLMYLPFYPKGEVPATIDARRQALLGYVYSPFRMNDLMQGILGRKRLPDIRLEIFDGDDFSPRSLMYDSQGDGDSGHNPATFSMTETLNFNDHVWTLRYRSLPAFEATIDRQKPMMILTSGLLVSGLLMAMMWAWSSNRRRARELAVANMDLQLEITERKKLTRELAQSKVAAEAANNAKSEFLANVSHELRTPLTLILAPLESLLANQNTPPHWRQPLERIQRNSLLLLARVSEILDFAKAEAGKTEVYWQAVDLTALLNPLIEDATLVANNKRCSLTRYIDPDLGKVRMDPWHFDKIAMNLVGNALKFTPNGGKIRVALQLIGNDKFEFSVENTGPGIPKDQQQSLFERFQQVDSSATRGHCGTGLGLALVKKLVEQMDGRVGVHSRSGQGVRVFVQLACGSEHLPEHEAMPDQVDDEFGFESQILRFQDVRQELPQSGQHPPIRGRDHPLPILLVVDDTPDMRAYIAEQLASDYQILTAADGQQAWELLQSQHVDLVISDIMMPGLDGLGLTARIRNCASLSHLPVILVTARGGATSKVSGLDSGADDYIAKPFSVEELKARVRSALRMTRIQGLLREQSHEAGMAMLASGILHNLGNALNGITVSCALLRDKLNHSNSPKLRKVASLLLQHTGDLEDFLNHHPKGQMVPVFLNQLGEQLEFEQTQLLKEVDALREHTEHAMSVVAAHQHFTKSESLREMVSASHLMETALKLSMTSFARNEIKIDRHYHFNESISIDKHKVLQILINLLINARHALADSAQPDKRVKLSTVCSMGVLKFEVSDNGIGIDSDTGQKLFQQGFTTKEQGHGIGLHLSANWAQEMGGKLQCYSDGPGLGATFSLELPLTQRCNSCASYSSCPKSTDESDRFPASNGVLNVRH